MWLRGFEVCSRAQLALNFAFKLPVVAKFLLMLLQVATVDSLDETADRSHLTFRLKPLDLLKGNRVALLVVLLGTWFFLLFFADELKTFFRR